MRAPRVVVGRRFMNHRVVTASKSSLIQCYYCEGWTYPAAAAAHAAVLRTVAVAATAVLTKAVTAAAVIIAAVTGTAALDTAAANVMAAKGSKPVAAAAAVVRLKLRRLTYLLRLRQHL